MNLIRVIPRVSLTFRNHKEIQTHLRDQILWNLHKPGSLRSYQMFDRKYCTLKSILYTPYLISYLDFTKSATRKTVRRISLFFVGLKMSALTSTIAMRWYLSFMSMTYFKCYVHVLPREIWSSQPCGFPLGLEKVKRPNCSFLTVSVAEKWAKKEARRAKIFFFCFSFSSIMLEKRKKIIIHFNGKTWFI